MLPAVYLCHFNFFIIISPARNTVSALPGDQYSTVQYCTVQVSAPPRRTVINLNKPAPSTFLGPSNHFQECYEQAMHIKVKKVI